ncbi:MAG TPA: DUF58 domain-containing protein [bacterium]|nr:DUF58 domain-containing protein [bacterium]
MITPRTRLIRATALIALPLALWAAAEPAAGQAAMSIFGAFLVIALADAALSLNLLDRVSASYPDVVRLTKDQDGEALLTLESAQAGSRPLGVGISFPPGLSSPHEQIVTALPEGSGRALVPWPITAGRRGNFALENIYLEAASRLGFWSIRKTSPARAEVRVYPNLRGERKNLAALFLNRGAFGLHAQRQLGKGREFEKLRDYIPGDGLEDIHWKATAKRGRPISKVYQIERTQEVYVAIDASRLSGRTVEIKANEGEGVGETVTQLERFITAAMVLGLVAEKQGDLFGMIAFNDQVRRFVRARNGKAHYHLIRDALYALEPSPVNPDFAELASFARLKLRRRSLIIFLTNLDDPVLAESFLANIEVLARHHLVLVNMLTAPGVRPLFTAPDVAAADDLYQRLGGHIQWRKLRELIKVLKRRGVSMALIENERMCPELVSQYINVKRRQLL